MATRRDIGGPSAAGQSAGRRVLDEGGRIGASFLVKSEIPGNHFPLGVANPGAHAEQATQE